MTNSTNDNAEHTKDTDCVVDSETDCCVVCGVMHGDACEGCAQRGFHVEGCEVMAETTTPPVKVALRV